MHDESGIAWDVETRDDGTRTLRVGCAPGRHYTIEQSADLAQWSPVHSWIGLASGQVVGTDIFAGPPPSAGPAMQTQGLVQPQSGPRTATVFLQPVDDGGTVLSWTGGNDGSVVRVREPASAGSWGPPTLVTLHVLEFEGLTIFLQSTDLALAAGSTALPPSSPAMALEDAQVHSLLLAHRADIAAAIQDIHDNQQAQLAARVGGFAQGSPSAGRYFRVREDGGLDTDGDGLTDEEELALGLGIFSPDTDGDGLDDRYEVENGFDPRSDADAEGDADGDGFSNLWEAKAGTDPNSPDPDTDQDRTPDCLDAAPADPAVDWRRTGECGYGWIPLTGYQPAAHGKPVAMNNRMQVLFERAVWSEGQWLPLKQTAAAVALEGGGTSTLVVGPAIDIDDDGRVLGRAELPDTVHGGDAWTVPVLWTEPSADPAIVGMNPGSVFGGQENDVTNHGAMPVGISPDGWICVSRTVWGEPGSVGTVVEWHAPGAPFSGPVTASPLFASAGGPPNCLWNGVAPSTRLLPGATWATDVNLAGTNGVFPVLFDRQPVAGGVPTHSLETLPAAMLGGTAFGAAPPSVSPAPEGAHWTVRPVVRDPSGGIQVVHPPEPGTSSRVWKASASLAGAAALNARGEAIDGAHGLWRNGCWHDLLDFVPEGTLAPGQTIWTHDLNDEGVVFVSVAAEETSPNSPEGQAAGAAVLPPCSLEIWNGQMPFYPKNSGPPPPVKDKFTTGAFTVANQNDTDGNGKPDKDDTKGVLGEADLMRLNVNGFLNMPGHAKLSVKAGSVALWEDSDKTRKIELDANHAVLIAIPNGGLDTTFWVEATAPSTAVGDIEIWLGHQPPQGALRDGMDKVKATGIWAVAGVNDGIILTGGRPDDLDGKDAKDTFQDFHASKFGIFDARPGKAEFYYSIGLEFKVLPSGVGNQACVKFDLSRQKEQSSWVEDVTQGWVAGPTLPFPKTPDEPNDDASFADEDREPTNDHIYCLDNPAIPIPPPGAPSRRIVKRANFREFVRVKVNGRAFRNLNNEREGSRCSDFLAWRMRGDIKLNNGAWELTAGGSNELQGGHAPLGNNP